MEFAAKTRKNKVVLLIIDPQCDFHPGGSLGVPGAIEDSERTAAFIRQHMSSIDEIYVSLDTHHRLHIAHGVFWTNSNGEAPAPFTLIKHSDVCEGLWTPKDPKHLEWAKFYTKSLEDKGRFTLCIWPEHCLIGTPGHNVYGCVNEALHEWSAQNMKNVHYSRKGEYCLTEMYSAISAEIPVPEIGDNFNTELFNGCIDTEKLVVCGQALSHCVHFTVRDIFDRLQQMPDYSASMINLLVDASSPVPGFESAGEGFINDMRDGGVVITTTTDFSP